MCIALHFFVCVFSGRPLSMTQEDIGIRGWAVECRVYAEVGGEGEGGVE